MKPLTDMTGSELLDEFSVLIHKLTVTPGAPEMAARRFALHGELLRRLTYTEHIRQEHESTLKVWHAAVKIFSPDPTEVPTADMLAYRILTSKAEGWVSVKERLPEMDGRKLQTWCVGISSPDENGWNWNTAHGQAIWTTFREYRFGVTHWRELPAPPKEG